MHYEVEQDEKNKAHWKARVEEVTTTLERVNKHVADAKAREAAIHDEATKVQKKLLTCFEEERSRSTIRERFFPIYRKLSRSRNILTWF